MCYLFFENRQGFVLSFAKIVQGGVVCYLTKIVRGGVVCYLTKIARGGVVCYLAKIVRGGVLVCVLYGMYAHALSSTGVRFSSPHLSLERHSRSGDKLALIPSNFGTN